MRYFTAVLLTLMALSFASSSWAGEITHTPPVLTLGQARALYPWAYGPSINKVPMTQMVPGGMARNLPDNGQDKTLEALKSGNLPPVRNLWGIDDPSRRSQGPIDFGNDVLVRTGSVPTSGKLSMDHSAQGHIFVTLYDPASAPNDTAFTYVSTDNGATWAPWFNYAGTTTAGRLSDVEIRVGDEASNPWVYVFLLYQSGSVSGVWCSRLDENITSQIWTEIAANGDTISQLSADRDNDPPYYLYCSYKGGALNLYHILSTDLNVSWTTRTYIDDRLTGHSEIALGTGNFYNTWQIDTTTIAVGRCTNHMSGSWAFTYITGQGISEWWPTIAASRTMTPASQTAWVLFRNVHSPAGIDAHYGYTTDGGATWTTTVWPPTNYYSGVTPNYPNLRVSYDYGSDLCEAVAPIYVAAFDSIIWVWSPASDPTTWNQRQIFNEHNQTSEFGPKVDITTGTGGAAVAYREYGSDPVWFDYWNNTNGVETGPAKGPSVAGLALASAQPNPLSKSTSIAFSLPKSGNVDLAVFDISGRKVTTLAKGTMSAGSHEVSWNGANAPAGVYLYRLSFEGKTLTNRMVVVK